MYATCHACLDVGVSGQWTWLVAVEFRGVLVHAVLDSLAGTCAVLAIVFGQ